MFKINTLDDVAYASDANWNLCVRERARVLPNKLNAMRRK